MNWRDTALVRRLGIRLPILQAPMAGGWTTPQLVAQVSEAGGLGSIAGAMLPPDALRAEIAAVRSRTSLPFAVNLFAPLPAPSDRGLTGWALLSGRPVLSFTFGIPPLADADCFTIGTATTVAEAVAMADAGVDAVVAQGAEAGGHRGTFLAPVEQSLLGTMALVPQVVDAVPIPVIASGGIMDGRGIAAARLLGAQAVQLGTAFLRTDEAGTGAAYRQALSSPTTVTRVLTGRAARAVRTPLVARLEAAGVEPPDYPLPRLFLTEPPFLAGQGGPLARSIPAGDLMALLEQETDAALESLG